MTYGHRGPHKNIPEDKSKEQIEATAIIQPSKLHSFFHLAIYLQPFISRMCDAMNSPLHWRKAENTVALYLKL